MPKARSEAVPTAPQEQDAEGKAEETGADRSDAPEHEGKGSFREKVSAFREKAGEKLGDWLKGRYSQEELSNQEMAVSLKAEVDGSRAKEQALLEALKADVDPAQRELIERELAAARETLASDKEDLDKVQGGMAKAILKGSAKAALTTGAVMAGLKFFPDAIRYAVQRREVSKERGRITEALEGDTETIKVDLGLRFDEMAEKVKESRHLSVEKRNELLQRLETVKEGRETKRKEAEERLADKIIEAQADLLVEQGKFDDVRSKFQAEEKAKLVEKGVNETAAQILAESAAKGFVRAHAVGTLKGEDAEARRSEAQQELEAKFKADPELKKQYDASLEAQRSEKERIDEETKEKIRAVVEQHVTTQVKGAEVVKQFINTAAMASGFGILRTVGYAGAAIVERYTRLKGEKAKEMGIEEKDAKVSVMKEVFLNGFTETMKELAFKGGTTKTEKAMKFVKALGITARAAGIAGIGLGELAGSGHSFSKAFEKVSDQWGQVWDKSDGPVDTMKNVAGQMVGNGVKNVENMAGFYKKVFNGELWSRITGSAEAAPAAGGAAAGVSAAESGPNQSIAETGPVAPPSPETNQHLMELASVRKGEGITHAIVRQLEDDPQKYGYKGDLGDKAALDKWAVLQSKKIAIDSGYIRPDGTETRVRGGGSYLLEKDQGGKLVAHKVGAEGKEYSWHKPRVPKVGEVPVAERPQLPKDWRAATERLTGGQPDAALDERVGQNLPAGDRGSEAVDEVRGALTERFKTLEQGIGERQAELGKVTQQLRLELEKPQPDRELLQRLGGRQHELRGQINDLEKTANAYYETFLKPRAVQEVPDTSTGRRPIVPLGERAEGRVPEVVPGAVEQSVPPTLEVRGNAAELLREQGVHIEGNTVRLDSGREFALKEVDGVRTERLVVTEVRGSDGRELRIQALNSDGSAEMIKVRDGVVIEERHVSAALRSAVAEQPLIKGVTKMTEEMQRPGAGAEVPVSRSFSELPAGRQADVEASIRGLELKQHNLSEDQVRGLATRFATEPAFGRNYRLEQVVLGESYVQNKMSKEALMQIINDPKQGYDQNRAAQWALGKMGVETGIRPPGRIVEAAAAGAVEQAVPAGRMGHVEAGGVDVRFQYGTDGKVIDAVEQGDMAAVRTQAEKTILQEHWRGVVGEKSFDLGKAWESVRQTVTEAQADKNAYDRLVASGQGSSPEAQFLKQQYESKLAGLRQRYGEDLFRKDTPPKVDLSAVAPGQEVGRIRMPHGEANFRYSDGKVVGVGLEMRTMSPEDLDRLNGQLREGWSPRLGTGPTASMDRSVILSRSRDVFTRTLALEALNKAGRGNTPEARFLTRSIDVIVAETEKKYGDVFK